MLSPKNFLHKSRPSVKEVERIISPRKYPIPQISLFLEDIYVDKETIVNSRKQSKMKYEEPALQYLELDIWIPEYDLCFEFQVLITYYYLLG